jgi:phytoene dehydrogenase-like protein
VIIGAGLSGLAAGIRLAYYEKSVCIVERHTTIGGLNSFYRLHRRDFDVGLHAVTNFTPRGAKTGPLAKILRQLRLKWDDFGLRPQWGSRVVFPTAELRFNNDFALLVSEVARAFPHQVDGFRKLVADIESYDDGALSPAPTMAREVLRSYLTNPLLIDMLLCPLLFYGSATPNDVAYHQFVILFKSIFQEGFGRPEEGVRRMLRVIVKQFRSLGGELRLRQGAQSILVDEGRAVGLLLDNGDILEADHLFSSAGLAETMRLCGEPTGDAPAAPSVEAGDLSFVETMAVLDRQPADLGHRDTILFYNATPEFRYENPSAPCDVRSGIICSPNNYEYEQPLPEGLIRITALADHRYWLRGMPEDEYVAAKERWRQAIVDSAVRFMPDFRPHITATDTFTPRTIRKFTGHINGCVYGSPQKRLDGRTHLPNLYLCGTDQGYLGIIGSMVSGISMANLHVLSAVSR